MPHFSKAVAAGWSSQASSPRPASVPGGPPAGASPARRGRVGQGRRASLLWGGPPARPGVGVSAGRRGIPRSAQPDLGDRPASTHPEPRLAVPGVPARPRQCQRARLLPQVSPPRSLAAGRSSPSRACRPPACSSAIWAWGGAPSATGAPRLPGVSGLRGGVRSRPTPSRAGVMRRAWPAPLRPRGPCPLLRRASGRIPSQPKEEAPGSLRPAPRYGKPRGSCPEPSSLPHQAVGCSVAGARLRLPLLLPTSWEARGFP